jgi:hypothetical protein
MISKSILRSLTQKKKRLDEEYQKKEEEWRVKNHTPLIK